MILYSYRFQTDIGPIELTSTDDLLLQIILTPSDSRRPQDTPAPNTPGESREGGPLNHEAARQIKAYLRGELRLFDLPHRISGGSFRRRVLETVAQIPYGCTQTYGDIARSLGKPGAARAVGRANGSNELPLLIPCHRVIAQSGLGGYGGGIELKRRLLELEQALEPTGIQQDLLNQGNNEKEITTITKDYRR